MPTQLEHKFNSRRNRFIGSARKMEEVPSTETLVPTYKSAQCHNPQDQHGHVNHHTNANPSDTCEIKLRLAFKTGLLISTKWPSSCQKHVVDSWHSKLLCSNWISGWTDGRTQEKKERNG
jgi:hypothetical protein